jgi:hypothetical protein
VELPSEKRNDTDVCEKKTVLHFAHEQDFIRPTSFYIISLQFNMAINCSVFLSHHFFMYILFRAQGIVFSHSLPNKWSITIFLKVHLCQLSVLEVYWGFSLSVFANLIRVLLHLASLAAHIPSL